MEKDPLGPKPPLRSQVPLEPRSTVESKPQEKLSGAAAKEADRSQRAAAPRLRDQDQAASDLGC